MSDLAYDISLVAPGPNAVKGGFARTTGAKGSRSLFYWVVAHFPIGVSIAGPIAIANAPAALTGTDAVLIGWDTEIGATSYDVLRTATPVFPATAGNYVVLGGIAPTAGTSTAIDQGQALTAFTPTTLTYGAPVTRHIYLNNRDYSQPTIELPAVKVSEITFPDGSHIESVSGAVGQSPWVGSIDGANFDLLKTATVHAGYGYFFDIPNTTTPRWSLERTSGSPETGGNSGSDMEFYRYDDAGNWIDAPTFIIKRATGYVGIATSDANTVFQVRPFPANVGTFTTRGAVLMTSATSNGGSAAWSAEPVLILGREGIPGQSYPNFVELKVQRYENVGIASRTQLDFVLTHGVPSNVDPIVLSLRSSGAVGINTNTPRYIGLDVLGDIGASGTIAAGQITAAGNVSIANPTGDSELITTRSGATGRFAATGTGLVYAGSFTNHPFAIYTNAAQRMIIPANGITTTVPGAGTNIVYKDASGFLKIA